MAKISNDYATVSAGWGFVCGDEFLFHAFAYDAGYGTYSPSRLFLECLVRHCMRQNVRTFDFMPGDEPYKRTWSDDFVRTDSFMGPINRRGKLLMWLAKKKPATAGTAVKPLRTLYHSLPRLLRNSLEKKLREYRSIDGILRLERPTAPPISGPLSKNDVEPRPGLDRVVTQRE